MATKKFWLWRKTRPPKPNLHSNGRHGHQEICGYEEKHGRQKPNLHFNDRHGHQETRGYEEKLGRQNQISILMAVMATKKPVVMKKNTAAKYKSLF